MSAAAKAPSALSNPVFRGLWIASVGSGIGATMHDTAAIWTLTLAASQAWIVTLYQSLLSLPLFFLALPAGAIADIADKRRLSMRVQIAGAAIAAVMAVCAFAHWTPVWLLLAGAAALGCAGAFGQPAWQALIPEAIEKPLMSRAIALGSLAMNLSRAIGPFLGGYLVSAAGPAPAFVLNALSFLAVAIVLARWRRAEPVPRPNAETVASAMVAALRHVRYSRPIQRVLLRHGLFTFAAIAPPALLPLMVRNLGLPGSSYGFLMGCYGLGAIVMGFVVLPRLRGRLGIDQLTLVGGFLSLAATAAMPFAGNQWQLAILLVPAGMAWLVGMAQLNLAGQSVFPHWVRARASAIHLLAAQGGISMGALLWGAVTQHFGISMAFVGAAAALAAYLVLTWWLPVDRFVRMDLSPVPPDHNHDALAFQPDPEAGPVRVSIRYEIRPDEETSFLAAISALRDTRLRDGAYRWNLWRDLEHPDVLWEVFLVGSWLEHLRQADRGTVLSREIENRVLAFHRGSGPPQVHHSLHLEPGSVECLPA
jgi:MFS family permease